MSTSYLSNGSENESSSAPIGALRQFKARKREPVAGSMEHCELCDEPIPEDHRHLLDIGNRRIVCACTACSLLFTTEREAGGGKYKYRVVPTRYLTLPDFQITDKQWDDLTIPVNMVYIFRNTELNRVVAFYPSPAGATESLLNLESWDEIVSNNPILNELEPDVEALLINRARNSRDHYIVPIDTCYQLVGLIRLWWKGLSGGEEVWKAIADFFADVRKKSESVGRRN